MSTSKILLKFAKKGINLSPEAYNRVINAENPTDFASSLIVKLKGDKFTSKDLVSVSGEMVDEITCTKKEKTDDIKPTVDETPQTKLQDPKKETSPIEELKKDSDKQEKHVNEEILKASETVEDTKIKFKRNEKKTNVQYDFKILQDTSKKSYIPQLYKQTNKKKL